MVWRLILINIYKIYSGWLDNLTAEEDEVSLTPEEPRVLPSENIRINLQTKGGHKKENTGNLIF